MSGKTFLGCVLMVVPGLVLIAAGILTGMQWDNQADFWLFGKNYRVADENGLNTALLMLLSGAGGVVVVVLVWLFVRGLRLVLRQSRRKRELARAVRTAQAAAAAPAAAPQQPQADNSQD